MSNKKQLVDRKKLLREQDRLTRPPRLEGVVKNKRTNPVRKKPLSNKPKGKKK